MLPKQSDTNLPTPLFTRRISFRAKLQSSMIVEDTSLLRLLRLHRYYRTTTNLIALGEQNR